MIDLVAISVIGLVSTVALGGPLPSEFGDLVSAFDATTITLAGLAGAAILFILKTLVALGLTKMRQVTLAGLETAYAVKLARFWMLDQPGELNLHSRAKIEWTILRSTQNAFTNVLGQFLQLVTEATLAILIFCLFIFVDWQLTVAVALYFAFVFVGLQIIVGRASQTTGVQVTSGSIAVGQTVQDFLSAHREIYVFATGQFFIDRISRDRKEVADAQGHQFFLQAFPRIIAELGLIAGVVLFAIVQIVAGTDSTDTSTIGIFIAGSFRMMSAFLPIQRAFMQLKYEAPQARDAQEMVQRAEEAYSKSTGESEMTPPKSPCLPQKNAGGIVVVLDNVSFSYPDSKEAQAVLQKISLEIRSGEFLAVIGPSGAGKSTLADLILGILTPSSGDVYLDGSPADEFRGRESNQIGYVPQKPGLISGTVRDNLCLGAAPLDFSLEELRQALRSAQLLSLVDSLPSGLDTDLGPHADQLSGGQIQRLGLARSLLRLPRLLVLDEATSALDEETQHLISESLNVLEGKATRIVIAHRLSTVRKADRIVVMDSGKIVDTGTLASLGKSNERVRRLIDLSEID